MQFRNCSIFGCNSSATNAEGSTSRTVTFHRFPKLQPTKRQWITNITTLNVQELKFVDLDSFCVCSKHFESRCFSAQDPRLISVDAVPSIFPYFSPSASHHLEVLQSSSSCDEDDKRVPANDKFKPKKKLVKRDLEDDKCEPEFEFVVIKTEPVDPDEVVPGVANSEVIPERTQHIRIEMIDAVVVGADVIPKPPEPEVATSMGTCKRRIRYAGDIEDNVQRTPEEFSHIIKKLKEKIKTSAAKIKAMRTKAARAAKKTDTYATMLRKIRDDKIYATKNHTQIFQGSFNSNVIDGLRRGDLFGKYRPEVRSFACTLYFYSPDTYEYVRTIFKSRMPTGSTIEKWLEGIDSAPGLTAEVHDVMRAKMTVDANPMLEHSYADIESNN